LRPHDGLAKVGRWRTRTRIALVLSGIAIIATVAGLSVSSRASAAPAAPAPVGNGFTVTSGDLAFILRQIKIAEHHAATLTPANPCGTLVGRGPDQIPDALTSYGLRTVDGSCNNLLPGREKFAAADVPFPRLSTPVFRSAEGVPAGFLGPGSPAVPSSTYAQKKGLVFDSQPRVISNLIVDQTAGNPAAVAAAEFPVRTQGNTGIFPCGAVGAPPPPACTPAHKTLFIPNVTTDAGLSPPYNSLFTFFGQFFDHGVDQTVKSGGTVFVPLHDDDPLVTVGPDGIPNTGDEVPVGQRFMVITRAQNQPGPDGILGDNPATPAVDESADDIQNANNTDTPWVDQSQTYTSHPSHQVFLREYVLNTANRPVSTGKLLGGLAAGQTYLNSPDGQTGIGTWAAVKRQAANLLGLRLVDADVTNVPMLATDPYGKFIPGPARGLPQYVTTTGLVEGNLAAPVPVPANVLHFDTPFLTDIAHNADPSPVDTDNNPATPPVAPVPDADNTPSADFAHQPAGTYDDEMLNAHFVCGDGRCNENIALSTIHQIFHSEHDRLVDYIKGVLTNDTSAAGVAALPEWQLPTAQNPAGWNGERLFQAARFVTEMEYQHLVFEEFARKMVPAIHPFHVYSPDVNPAIPAEFAHAVYRFGHSMLDETVARTNVDPVTGAKSDNSRPLLEVFLNPPALFDGGTAGVLTPERAAGSVVMGSVDQVGNEIDEFVTETLRNNLLGLPLDLPTLNMARARSEGVPPLNELRRQIQARTNDSQMAPYTSWDDYGQHLKHPESLINFVAAYGTHPSITSETTLVGKRAAATALVNGTAGAPADATDFMNSSGAWSNDANGVTRTGLDSVDLWVGGLAEKTELNGGLLGTTFNYVFQLTLEQLQDGDRLYYLARTPGLNLRTQLEGNSFAEMIERNTDGTNTLKADVFATADCKFQMANLNGTAAGFTASGATVADDPSTPDCDESALLLRKPDGTIQYKQINSVDPPGINGQAVYNGSAGVDRIFGGNDNDTFWGNAGNDVIEGNAGDDTILGGDGNDIITDLQGADVLKGGPGNDAIDGGPGNDLITGGDGSDFINAGANDNESFGGPGNDFMIAGQGADTLFGDGGDDWIEGGTGQDLLQGDHGAPFFDDPGEVQPGNDVFVGQPGENDYDAEGGDDIMVQNDAIDRNAGAGGFDWAIHQYDTTPANDDMMINNNLAGLPVQLVVNRDRWQETEADSGSPFNDVIKGTDGVVGLPRVIGAGTGGFQGCDVLDQAGLDRIKGLDALVPPLTGDVALPQPGVDPLNSISGSTSIIGLSASGRCPLQGAFWGEGDIELGGAGSDTFTGRQGNDIIDGDQELQIRISVRTNPADPATEIGTTDLMEHQYLHDAAGNPTGATLQQAVFAGTVDPGNLVIVREIVNHAGPTDIDTSVYTGPRSQYIITSNADGSTTICDSVTIAAAAGEVLLHEALKGDGCDILWRIEQLQFADGTITMAAALAPAVSTAPAAGLSFGNQIVNTGSGPQAVTVTNTGNGPLSITGLSIGGLDFAVTSTTCLAASVAPGGTCTVNIAFNPQALGARSSTLQIADNAAGSPQGVPLTGNGIAAAGSLLAGTATVGTKSDSNVAGLAEAFKTTASSNGSVNQLRIFVDTGSVGPVVVGLYANSATNHPGVLLTSGTLVAPAIGQFNTITVPTANVTAGLPYWIAVLGPTGAFHFRDKAAVGAGNSETNVPGGLTGLPASWTTGASFSDGSLSGYAAGTILAGPPADTTIPTVAMTAPAAAATVSGATVAVSANAADNVGVAGVQFRLDGGNLGAEDTTAPYSVNWNTTAVANGTHTLTAIARDAAGNTATATTITVTVNNVAADTTNPTVSMTAPAAAATVSGAAVAVSANAADNIGVAGVQFKDGVTNIGAEDTTAPYTVNWNTTAVANGSHTLSAVARDAAGNTATATVTVTVSNVAGPPPGTILLGNAATELQVDSNAAGRAEAFKTTAAVTGSVTQLRLFINATSTATSVVVGLYTNSATNHPGTLLTTGTITAPVAGVNNSVTVAGAPVTAGTTYWIAVLGPAGVVRFRDRAAVGAGASETSSLGTLTSLPATWTTGTGFTDGFLSAVGIG
jgi:Ca2+-binding RTX toxin-like protein